MSLDLINLWHQRARPAPTEADFNVQLGCHFEEIAEMLECISFEGGDSPTAEGTPLHSMLAFVAMRLKQGKLQVAIADRKGFLDSIADQIVTGVGVANCAKMDAVEATRRVNRSNWTKFDLDGLPIRDANGKITKGPNYVPPNLEGLY